MNIADVIKTAPIAVATEMVRVKLASDLEWAKRGLLAIYSRQTATEQSAGSKIVKNDVGFTGADAEILSSFATQVKAGRALSSKQIAILFKRMPKYAGQLTRSVR